jgi:hypothetical protein
LEDLGIDWTIILKRILKKWDGRHGMAQDRNRWLVLVHAEIKVHFP